MISKKKLPSTDRVKTLLTYRPDTGVFKWKKQRGRVKPGDIAGSISGSGYIVIRIDCEVFFAHRLAWLYHHGYNSENDIDHIDRDRLNNKINNLRESSHACNIKNSKPRINNTSGVTGVYWQAKNKIWRTSIAVCGKLINLGHSKDFDEAVMKRWQGEIKYNYHKCNPRSCAFLYLKNKGLT